MIFNGDVRGLAGLIYNNPPKSGMRGFIYNNPPRSGLRGYGVEASDVGTAVGAGTGSLFQQLFPGIFPQQQITYPGYDSRTGQYGPQTVGYQPSWWAQQNTGTKALIGGLGLLGVAAVIVKLKK